MDRLEVILPSLAGFGLDLHHLSTNFSSNVGRLLPGVTLPSESGELMSTLAPAFGTFYQALTTAHSNDLTTVRRLGTHLADAKYQYRGTEKNSSEEFSETMDLVPTESGASHGVQRYSALHLPDINEVEDIPGTVHHVVRAGIQLIGPYDGPLGQKIGLKPAADYLEPIMGDWGALQAVGERIGLLSVNDHVASENLTGGTNWLQTSWVGEGGKGFGDRTGLLRDGIAGRSGDLDAVSRIVQNGGLCMERLVYNQAVELSSGISQPMTFVGLALPLGVWALLTDHPMQESNRSEILSAVDSLHNSVKSRHAEMTTMLDHVSTALNYSPDRTPPTFHAGDFEPPAKLVPSTEVMRYGFGSNTWWQNTAVSDGYLSV